MELNELRTNYIKLVSDKKMCEKMILELSKIKNKTALHLCYLGASQTIWAVHIYNPINKLNTFNTGKKNIENAINQEPNNIELRFIRLSVQMNTPAFLGYKFNISEDTDFIEKNKQLINSFALKKNIAYFLKE